MLVPLENTIRCQRVISQENMQPKTQIVGSNVESNYSMSNSLNTSASI